MQSTAHYARSMGDGGAHNTHNTSDCKKYNSDGTPKKGFAGKSAQRNTRNESAQGEQKSNYAQLSAKIAKLERSNKKLKRANKKRKRDRASVIATATATTPTHPDVMGPVALGK